MEAACRRHDIDDRTWDLLAPHPSGPGWATGRRRRGQQEVPKRRLLDSRDRLSLARPAARLRRSEEHVQALL